MKLFFYIINHSIYKTHKKHSMHTITHSPSLAFILISRDFETTEYPFEFDTLRPHKLPQPHYYKRRPHYSKISISILPKSKKILPQPNPSAYPPHDTKHIPSNPHPDLLFSHCRLTFHFKSNNAIYFLKYLFSNLKILSYK